MLGDVSKAGTLVVGAGARLKNYRKLAARIAYSCGVAALALLCGSRVLQNAIAEGDTRTISLHHIHTNEDITITFKRDGRYDETALDKLNWFLRDWRREQQIRMDPHLIDLIWEVQREAGSHEPVWVVCGYRSPETNEMLRRSSSGVARFSQHTLGHAMDFYIPGVPLEQLRVIGLRLQRGGVGFYPTSGSPFVHMDTGSVRHWPRMTRDQLVRVFPDGRTVHVPSDGRPLAGYALALADLKQRGDSPSEMSIDAARRAGVDVASADAGRHTVNPLAKLFGLGSRDDEEDDAGGASAAAMAANAPAPAAEPLRTRAKAAVVAAVDRVEDKLAADKSKLAQLAANTVEKLTADKSKLAQLAANTAEKVAADKTKVVQAASKVHVISRAEAATAAVQTPNQVIIARGFWQGLPDGMTAGRPANATNPLAALSSRTASISDSSTGALSPFSSLAPADRVPPESILAYAEQSGGDVSARQSARRATVTGALAVATANNEMTVAMKRVSGRPASAIVTLANGSVAVTTDGARLDDPWLRAVLLCPSVTEFLSISALGVRDFRFLAALMAKPANSVMMTFATEPNPGLSPDHFDGSAIVFISTVTYPLHTADLR